MPIYKPKQPYLTGMMMTMIAAEKERYTNQIELEFLVANFRVTLRTFILYNISSFYVSEMWNNLMSGLG